MGTVTLTGRVAMKEREGLELHFGDRINRTMDGPRWGGGQDEGRSQVPSIRTNRYCKKIIIRALLTTPT